MSYSEDEADLFSSSYEEDVCGGYYSPGANFMTQTDSDSGDLSEDSLSLEGYVFNGDADDVSLDDTDKPKPNPLQKSFSLTSVIQEESNEELYKWNLLFQNAVDREEGPQRWKALSKLGRDFVYTSKTYGKIIIGELSLPTAKKTIKPVAAGGRAGGMKYIAAGIFFKFALDTLGDDGSWMYGGNGTSPYDEGAIKAASNDMLGLLAYYNSGVEGLHYPLLCIVDYRGYRLLAMSILPIGKAETLAYGSQDASKHVVNSNRELSIKMKQVGEELGLKEHKVQGTAKKLENGILQEQPVIKICAPVDIEGHIGTDGKLYVLDFGRTFPPETPSRPGREVFYNLLRPEFVRQYEKPLSSDGYSSFGRIDSRIHNAEIYAATKYLHEELIPRFVEKTLYPIKNARIDRLTELIHREGINCRHLGKIRSCIEPNRTNLLRSVLSEMLARILKSILRLLQRTYTKNEASKQEPYKRIAFKVLKATFSPMAQPLSTSTVVAQLEDDDISVDDITLHSFIEKTFWTLTIKQILQKHFKKALCDEELRDGRDIRLLVDMSETISRFCSLSGVRLRDNLLEEYTSDPASFRFMNFDLRKLAVRVRHLNVIDEAEGNLLFREAITQTSVRAGIWNVTHEKFERAVASNTNNHGTFLQWGKVFYYQSFLLSIDCPRNIAPAELAMKRQEIFAMLEKALEKFHAALEIKRSFECLLYIGLMFLEFGVINHIHSNMATVSRNAESQWQINLAAGKFREAFETSPDAFKLICDIGKETYNSAIKCKSTFQCNLYLLRAFYIQYAAVKSALVPPDAQYFFDAAYYLIEYSKRGGQDPGFHLAGAAGSMIESALLRYPALSDGRLIVQLDQSSRYLPELSNEQHCISRPAYIYQIHPDVENPDSQLCHLMNKSEIRPHSTMLHFMPFTVNDPSLDNASVYIGQLFSLLGQFATSPNLHTSKLAANSFILYNSACNQFLLTTFEVGVPLDCPQSLIPNKITLIGSNHLPEMTSNIIGEGDKIICAVSPQPGANSFSVDHRSPHRYLIVLVESRGTEYSLNFLSFFGVQTDPTIVREPETPADSIVYEPPEVKWSKSNSESIVVHENLASISLRKNWLPSFRKSAKSSKLKIAALRATPAFTLRWDPKQAEDKNSKHVQCIIILIDPAVGSLLHRELIQNIRSAFNGITSSNARIKIKSFDTEKSMEQWLSRQDLGGKYAKSLLTGKLRIASYLRAESDTKEAVSTLLNLRQSKREWRGIPTLFFASTPKQNFQIPKDTALAWTTNKRRDAIDFMAMRMKSDSLDFDPHREFGNRSGRILRDRNKKRSRRISKSTQAKKSVLEAHHSLTVLPRRMSSDAPKPTEEIRGPFLYFEVTFVGEIADQITPTLSVGLSTKNFIETELVGECPGSFGYKSSGILVCGDSSPYKFRDLVRADYTINDTIGCGYNQQKQEIYWTKNGRYLGVIERGLSQVPLTSKPLFATVSTRGFAGNIDANFGQQEFKFNPKHLEKIFEHSSSVPDEIASRQIHPFGYDLLNYEHMNNYLPVIATMAQFSASMQLLLRAYTEHSNDFKIIDLSQYYYRASRTQESFVINDNVLIGIANILPRKTFALNLGKCRKLSECFIEKIGIIRRMHMLNLTGIDSLSDRSIEILVNNCRLLQYLKVWENISDAALLEIPKLENLRTLDLSTCKNITCKGVCNMLRKTQNLTCLMIEECENLTDETLVTLARTQPKLERVSMDRTEFTERGVIQFISNAKSLLSLGIGGWGVRKEPYTDAVVNAICEHLSGQIRGLSLYRSAITNDGLKKLISRCGLLQELNVGNMPQISDSTFSYLAQLKNLSRLELMASKISDHTFLALVQEVSFTELSIHRCYELSASAITSALESLFDCTFLCLKETNADKSIIDVVERMKSLKTIDIRRTPFEPSDIEILKSIPSLNVFDNETIGDIDGRLYLMWDVPNSRVVNVHKRKRSR